MKLMEEENTTVCESIYRSSQLQIKTLIAKIEEQQATMDEQQAIIDTQSQRIIYLEEDGQ